MEKMKKTNCVGLEVINNSMSPVFNTGDIVIFDRNQKPKNGEYGGFILNGKPYICKYKEKMGKKYLLFKKTKIKIKSIDYFEILGRVKSKYFEV